MPMAQKRFSLKLELILLALIFGAVAGQSAFAGGAPSTKADTPSSRWGKSTMPVTISYTVPETNEVGVAVNVTINLKTLADVNDFKLEIRADEGLTLSPAGAYAIDYGNCLKNKNFSETVTVIPGVQGRSYFNLFISGIVNGKKRVDTLSVPVNAGSVTQRQMKTSGQTSQDTKGKKIIIMPAEEKTR